jgi:hypothetical protein
MVTEPLFAEHFSQCGFGSRPSCLILRRALGVEPRKDTRAFSARVTSLREGLVHEGGARRFAVR